MLTIKIFFLTPALFAVIEFLYQHKLAGSLASQIECYSPGNQKLLSQLVWSVASTDFSQWATGVIHR